MLAALKWVINKPNVSTTIPSMTDMDQLDENLKAMAQPFSAGDEKLLAAHLEQISPLYCRMCGQCDGACQKGLPVADVLRFLTYADGYGQFALGRERFLGVAPRTGCSPLRRLHPMHGEMSLRRPCIGPHGARPGIVCMKAAGLLLYHPVRGWHGARPGLSQLPIRARLGTVRA